MNENNGISPREAKIRNIINLYYSRKDIQKAIYEFSKNREICPRYFEGFGKRPDSFQYVGDVFGMVKKGATSFHCSQELWQDPMKIITGMTSEQANELRMGWDLLIDIDSKYIDYSKICAELIINFLKIRGIKKIGVKFSGNKGFHIIIPWKAFPEEIGGVKTKNMFPELARIITKYITEQIRQQLINKISGLEKLNKYVKDFQVSQQVIPDIVLVSPRHLFRMPYSLHEKTALASVVLAPKEILKFDLKDADPLKAETKEFISDSKEGEAKELVREALDWAKENEIKEGVEEKKPKGKYADFKPISLTNIQDSQFPPCIKLILNGLQDGKKRALFILINLLRSIGMNKEEMEKKINEWNKKNNPQLQTQYINSQLLWAYKKKPILPPNCKEFYQGIGVCNPDNFCKLIKNPANYVIRKNFSGKKK